MVRLPPAAAAVPRTNQPPPPDSRHVEKPLKLSLAGSESRDVVVDDDVGFVQAPLG